MLSLTHIGTIFYSYLRRVLKVTSKATVCWLVWSVLNYNATEGLVHHQVGLHFIYKTKLRTVLCCSKQYLRN